jgi:phosphatidate cytidylyltransferase
MNNILVRTLSGAIFISLILTPLFLENPVYAIVVLLGFMLLGIVEYGKLFSQVGNVTINWKLNTFFSLLMSAIITLIYLGVLPHVMSIVIFPLFFIWNSTELWRKKEQPLVNIGISIYGFLYVCMPLLLAIAIHLSDNNQFPLLAGMFILIWTNDTFAFLSGKFFGKTKLFERISPKKTWEGTIGGIIFTLLIGFWIISVLWIVPAAIYGDLLESLFKRSLGVKDSGNIMPGHGGILDRFDASFFAIPFFYVWNEIYQYYFTNINF